MSLQIVERSPTRALAEHLDRGLGPGQLGVILARPGVGKTTLLVHFALDALLRETPVLHVALRDTVDHVRVYYEEILAALGRSGGLRDKAAAMVAAERHRMVHSFHQRPFSVDKLRTTVSMLADVAHFTPQVIVLDGLSDADLARHLPELSDLARERNVVFWATGRLGEPSIDMQELLPSVELALKLSPEEHSVRISAWRRGELEGQELPVELDPSTMLVLGKHGDGPAPSATLAPRAADCTLYSGGANGAEEAFGQESEAWGLNEVNFTFEGHKQARSRGRYELSPRELVAGDVSLVYVSRRLNRTYSEGSLIRRVLQSIWHMVSRSQQVFVIGDIQEDGTVKGGTGWSVELARMWNKSLWVFDQGRSRWFRWDGEAWVPGLPVIQAVHFAGTGTRYLTDEGRQAVKELFERSFGRQD